MVALTDTGVAAIIAATFSGIAAVIVSVGQLLSSRYRKETRAEFRGKDSNGNTLREEVQGIERMLTEHVRQTELHHFDDSKG